MEKWPAPISGILDLVDKDHYGESNGQRYAWMCAQDIAHAKVTVMRERLKAAHPDLTVNDHPQDMNTYCSIRGYELPMHRTIVGLDSPEARRQAALKLPERAINMWTGGIRCGASRYLPQHGSACLACDYLEDISSQQDEVGVLAKQLSLVPGVIRDLLDSVRGLSEAEANIIASRWNVASTRLVGEPLRSILPVLCAVERIQLPGQNEAVDVPFAFASLFAGIAGFAMLLKDLASSTPSEGWSQNVFKLPTAVMRDLRHAQARCVCCTERNAAEIDSSVHG